MRNLKTILLVSIGTGMLLMAISMAVYAASTSFTVYLPANQEDVEVSTVRKETNTDYLTVTLTFIGPGTDKVCVWAEKPAGGNYSKHTKQVGLGNSTVYYDIEVPKVGANVVLNMDNPVKLDYRVHVDGSWTPN